MKIAGTPPIGLVATHAALATGVHGVTGTLCGTSDAQTLTNKTIGAGGLTFTNEGAGGDPILSSDYASQALQLTGNLIASLDFYTKSGTAFLGYFTHGISANRNWALPDVAGNVLIEGDSARTPTFTSVTVLNAGAGADPILTSDHAGQNLNLAGGLYLSGVVYGDTDLYFKSETAFYGRLMHNISANRQYTFPDTAGTVCMWGAVNAAVTRIWSIDGHGLLNLVSADQTRNWIYDTGNSWLDSASTKAATIAVNLPHGAVVTALRVTGQETATAILTTRLVRYQHSDMSTDDLASLVNTDTMAEVADTSISNATIDNDTYGYAIRVTISNEAAECRLRAIQIDYTVTFPYA